MATVGTVVKAATEIIGVLSNSHVQEMLCGTYTDGETRSFADAWNGEFISPSDKKKILFGEEPKKKKKKRKKKKKGKNKRKVTREDIYKHL